MFLCLLFKCYLERTLVNDKYMFKTNLICLTLTLRKCKINKSHREKFLILPVKTQFFLAPRKKQLMSINYALQMLK